MSSIPSINQPPKKLHEGLETCNRATGKDLAEKGLDYLEAKWGSKYLVVLEFLANKLEESKRLLQVP